MLLGAPPEYASLLPGYKFLPYFWQILLQNHPFCAAGISLKSPAPPILTPNKTNPKRTMEFTRIPHPAPTTDARRAEIMASPGFGKFFTDHMLTMTYTSGTGWHDAFVMPYGPIAMSPAAAVLHYAQEIFEGMKAYRHADGSVWTFRPKANAARFNRSAKRLAMPEIPEADFVKALEALVGADKAWVSSTPDHSLYLRPFMFATEAFLGVRPANEYKFMVIASPVASYFAGGVKPVTIWLSEHYTRAAKGGTGAAKCGGNYAAGLAAQMEASAHGCDQVVFVDTVERKWVEELGGMNLYFVMKDGTLVTPPTGGTILEGITRISIFQLAQEYGLKPVERAISIDEWKAGVANGNVKEIFACGTAAVITPVGKLVWEGGSTSEGKIGEITTRLRNSLMDVQFGRAPDTHGWMHRLV
jgi:branched-chain amino acid aminotransferase